MYHTTLQTTSGQLVFRCDIILNTLLISDWKAIRLGKKEKKTRITNQKCFCKPHRYRIWGKVFVHKKN